MSGPVADSSQNASKIVVGHHGLFVDAVWDVYAIETEFAIRQHEKVPVMLPDLVYNATMFFRWLWREKGRTRTAPDPVHLSGRGPRPPTCFVGLGHVY